VALAYGAAIEGLLGFKSVGLLMDPLRRELWSLAHFHAAFLAILNLVYANWADRDALAPPRRRAASRALLLGSAVMPVGFFLGGAWHPEGDPGIGIFLVPVGAGLLIYAVGAQALASWRGGG
jgi:hypothetical protein